MELALIVAMPGANAKKGQDAQSREATFSPWLYCLSLSDFYSLHWLPVMGSLVWLRFLQMIGLVVFVITATTYISAYGLNVSVDYNQENSGHATVVALAFSLFLTCRVIRWLKADLK